MQCPRCKGDGLCTDCNGTGSVPCITCEGKGERSTPRGLNYTCKSCEGSGSTECPKVCASCEGRGEITEKLQKEAREKYRPKLANHSPSNKVTVPLLILNVVIFLVLQVDHNLGQGFYLHRASFDLGQYWALITPSFIHLAWWHILLNMNFLWFYGPIVEGVLGKKRFVLLYLCSSLTAGSVSWLGNVYIEGNHFAGIGASGPLFGLVGAMLAIHFRWKMLGGDQVKRQASWFGLFIILGFAADAFGFELIDNWGHLGGALGGFLLMYILPRPSGR